MATYQILYLDSKDRVQFARVITCESDEQAIARASRMVTDQPAELWSGDRLVQRIEPRPPNK